MNRKARKFYFLLTISAVTLVMFSLFATVLSHMKKEQGPPTLRIGVAMYSQEDTFIRSLVQNLEQMAQQRESQEGIRININVVDGKSSQLIQNEQIEHLITLDYDILCVNIVDRTAASTLIDQARRAEIPIIFFNRQPVMEDLMRWEYAYYVGAPAEQSGSLQGQIALDIWNNQRERIDINGDGVLQYVILEGEPGHQDTLIRTEKCIQLITDAGVRVEKLISDTANWNREQAAAKMTSWWQEFGSQIEVVFANNDDMALGVLDVMQQLEVQPPYPVIIGVDATSEALEAVANGTMSGTVLNDGVGIAQTMLELSLSLYYQQDPAQKFTIENQSIWLPYRPITQKEIEQFLTQQESTAS